MKNKSALFFTVVMLFFSSIHGNCPLSFEQRVEYLKQACMQIYQNPMNHNDYLGVQNLDIDAIAMMTDGFLQSDLQNFVTKIQEPADSVCNLVCHPYGDGITGVYRSDQITMVDVQRVINAIRQPQSNKWYLIIPVVSLLMIAWYGKVL